MKMKPASPAPRTTTPTFAAVCLGAALAISPVAASAQAAVEVGPDHWAHKAVKNLIDKKVLVGYTDEQFRGGRPMSRHEFAAAAFQVWMATEDALSQLKDAVDALLKQPIGADSGAQQRLQQAARALGSRIASQEEDRAQMAKVMKEFEGELAALGVDVDQLKIQLQGIDARTAALESKKPLIILTGEVSLHALAGWSNSNRPGLMTSGFHTGLGEGSYAGQPAGLTRDLQILHEAAFTVKSQDDAPVRFKGTFIAGNLLASYGGYSPRQNGPLTTGQDDLALDSAEVQWSFLRVRGKGELTLGRFGHRASQYILQRPDTTDLFSNPRWDDGSYRIDGARLVMSWPDSEVTLFGGRLAGDRGINGSPLTAPTMWVVNTLPLPVNEALGASVELRLNPRARVKGGYMYLDSDQATPGPKSVNRMISLGGELNLDFGGFEIDGGVAKPILKRSGTTVIDNENESLFAQGTINFGKAKVTGGYRHIESFSTNLGDWGRFGTIQNPTGIETVFGKLFLPLGGLQLSASYEEARGMSQIGSAGIGKKDKLRSLGVTALYSINDTWSLLASYESARWDFAAGTDPYQSWMTLSARGRWSNTQAALGIQTTDSDSRGRPFLPAFGGSGRFKGGVLFSQVTLRF